MRTRPIAPLCVVAGLAIAAAIFSATARSAHDLHARTSQVGSARPFDDRRWVPVDVVCASNSAFHRITLTKNNSAIGGNIVDAFHAIYELQTEPPAVYPLHVGLAFLSWKNAQQAKAHVLTQRVALNSRGWRTFSSLVVRTKKGERLGVGFRLTHDNNHWRVIWNNQYLYYELSGSAFSTKCFYENTPF